MIGEYMHKYPNSLALYKYYPFFDDTILSWFISYEITNKLARILGLTRSYSKLTQALTKHRLLRKLLYPPIQAIFGKQISAGSMTMVMNCKHNQIAILLL